MKRNTSLFSAVRLPNRFLALLCSATLVLVALAAASVVNAPPSAAATICNKKCDNTDAAQSSGSRIGDDKAIDGRSIRIIFDDDNAMGWGAIENSSGGDQVWVDRSFDGGRSWEQLGVTTNPGGFGGWRTQMYNVDDWNTAGVGALRACGKKSGGSIGCTQWARVTWNASGRVNAAATSLAMYFNRSLNLFQTSYDSSVGPGWGGAVATSSLIRSIKATGMPSYRYILERTYNAYKDVQNGSGKTGFRNNFSDDTGWWAIAWIDAYDLTGQSKYLDAAKDGAAHMKTFWSSDCGGGLRWKNGSSGKVTISNTLYVQVNAALANRVPSTQKQTYVDEAVKTWNWLKGSPLYRSNDNRFWDGMNVPACTAQTNTLPYTYHNGTLVSGLTSLSQYYGSTGNTSARDTYLAAARNIANAITQTGGDFTASNGIMRDPAEGWDGCESDGAYFKAAAARGLDELDRTLSDRPYRSYLQANANSAYGTRNKLDQYSLKWNTWLKGPGQGCQASALALLAAAQ